MYNLRTRSNPTLFLLALVASITAIIYFQPLSADKLVEVPLAALYLGEIGLALLVALLFYENASIGQIVRLAGCVLGFSLLSGAIGNYMGQHTQHLPEGFVLISWVQLAIMNSAGVLCTLTLYKLEIDEALVPMSRRRPAEQESPAKASREAQRESPRLQGGQAQVAAAEGEAGAGAPSARKPGEKPIPADRPDKAREILEQLDVSRINRLERSLRKEDLSLENLFSEESSAAQKARPMRDSGTYRAPLVTPARGTPPIRLGAVPQEETADPAVAAQLDSFLSRVDEALNKPSRVEAPELLTGEEAEAGAGAEPQPEPEPFVAEMVAKIEASTADAVEADTAAAAAADYADAVGAEAASLPAPPAALLEEALKRAAREREAPEEAPGEGSGAPVLDEAADEPASTLKEREPEAPAAGDTEASAPQDKDAGDAGFVLAEPEAQEPAAGSGVSSLKDLLQTERLEKLEPLDEAAPEAVADSGDRASTGKQKAGADAVFEAQVDADVEEAFKRLVPKAAQKDVSADELARMRMAGEGEQGQAADGEPGPTREPVTKGQADDLIASLAASQPDASEPGEAPAAVASAQDRDEPEEVVAGGDEPLAAGRKEPDVISFEPAPEETSVVAEPRVGAPDAAQPKEVKEFGRLASAKASPPEAVPTGTMKTIGKMLVDTQAVENIIRAGEGLGAGLTTTRVISEAEGRNIAMLLEKVAALAGVSASILVGHDGLVVASSIEDQDERDSLGALALAVLGNTDVATRKLDLGSLRQIVLRSGEKLTILTAVPSGVLAVLSRYDHEDGVDLLLRTILETVQGRFPDIALPSCYAGAAPAAGRDPGGARDQSPAPRQSESGKAGSASASREKPAPPPAEPRAGAGKEGEIEQAEAPAEPAPDAATARSRSGASAVAADLVRNLIESLAAEQDAPGAASDKGDEAPEKEPLAEQPAGSGVPSPDDAPEAPKSPSAARPPKEVKEFGRLSTRAAPADDPAPAGGGMKSIGKMLIDAQAVENIIKTAENRGQGLTTARVISAARGEGIRALLARIDNCPGAMGSLIVGHDGLVIASTLGPKLDKDTMGAMSSSIHSNTNLGMTKLELGGLKQSVLRSGEGFTILTEVEVGVLAVFTDGAELGHLDSILAAIDDTVAG